MVTPADGFSARLVAVFAAAPEAVTLDEVAAEYAAQVLGMHSLQELDTDDLWYGVLVASCVNGGLGCWTLCEA